MPSEAYTTGEGCVEGAGIVFDVGTGVHRFSVETDVAGGNVDGAAAELEPCVVFGPLQNCSKKDVPLVTPLKSELVNAYISAW